MCREGEELSSSQAQVLKLLEEKQASFRLNLLACWNKGGKFRVYLRKPKPAKDAMET